MLVRTGAAIRNACGSCAKSGTGLQSIMKIDAELVREVRKLASWFIALPDKIVEMVMKPQESYLIRRERIKKLKELVELREVGKEIQHLYIAKGSIVSWVEQLQNNPSAEYVIYVRELFSEVETKAKIIKDVLSETALSNSSLGTDAASFLSRMELAYKRLAELPSDVLLQDSTVREIAGLLERMQAAGAILVQRVDEHRKYLDGTYG